MKLKWSDPQGRENISKLLKSGAALAELAGGTDSARNFGYGQKHSNRPGPHDQEVNDDGTKKVNQTDLKEVKVVRNLDIVVV